MFHPCPEGTGLLHKYQVDDLYKASIKTIMNSEGGILVIPLNFLTDKRTQKLRTEFLEKYTIKTINIFNDPVFDNTNYQICSFSYLKKDNSLTRVYLLSLIHISEPTRPY